MQNSSNLNTATHAAVTVGATTTAALAANSYRTYVLLVNDSDEVIYIKIGAAAVMNEGIRLSTSGGSFEMSQAHNNLCSGAINAICTSGSKKLLVTSMVGA